LPFLLNLPGLGFANQQTRKQRLVIMFSPNGVVPKNFWPDEEGAQFTLKESLTPLEPYRDRTLILKGVCDKVRGDGDNHMRGIGCLLTGIELLPGNIQGGSHTPAGWSSGISIDQEIKNYLQTDAATKTRFGSLELGVLVPDKADTWTRMSYLGANKPVAPIDDPYQLFGKLYGRTKDRESLKSVLDSLQSELATLRGKLSTEDRQLLDDQTTLLRELETELKADSNIEVGHAVPDLEKGVKEAAEAGVLAGFPVVDIKVSLIDGSFHEVDSNEMAFKMAGSMAFKEGVHKGGAVLLEPIMKVEAVVPEEYLGDVIGQLNGRRGMIQGMELRPGNAQAVNAQVPMGEMFGYATQIRSATQGRGVFSMEFDHYAPVSDAVAQTIIKG